MPHNFTYPHHHGSQSDNQKLDSYLSGESQRQFSNEKREQIEEEKLGKAKMGEELQYEYEQAKEHAKIKGLSVRPCAWCGKPAFLHDVKQVPVCDKCSPGRDAIERRLKQIKGAHLTPGDAVKIANSRTTRTGPFFNPKSPKFIKVAAKPKDKIL
ncbi:MAG TPA: hypothetical protein VLH94_04160 [Spirochaetia bacterium]|nr:hypothetical protein [Spirochaetia bacterium]